MLFAFSIVLICIAHCVRVYRWELFINTYEKPNRKNLFRALSVGYLFNAFLPMKLGDLARMWISGNKMKNGKGFSFAIIIVERCLDIIVVGIIFLLFYIFKIDVASESLWFYVVLAGGLLLFIGLMFAFGGGVKKLLKLAASLFNENIEFRVLKFSWALIWSFKDIIKRISKMKLVLSTILMWGAYIFSYFLFAEFLTLEGFHIGWHSIFYVLFAENSMYFGDLGIYSLFSNNVYTLVFFTLYILLPSIIVLLSTFFTKSKNVEGSSAEDSYLNLIPHLDKKERLVFLEMYFSNDNREYVENYLEINQHIEIIRDYSAGSNATTMLCRDKDKMFFRKYAFGADGDKLYDQIKWIGDYSNALTLTPILKYTKKDNYCYYDMPYNSGIETMFDYAHSHQLDSAWAIIEEVLNELKESIYKIDCRKSDSETIKEYVSSKVIQNIDRIINADGIVSKLVDYDFVVINGVKYKNLKYYLRYLNEQHLSEIFINDNYSVIHGDLTIENIIVKNSTDESDNKNYYMIDPNTGNFHSSPFLDYAKLLQSIHGGYEFLMEQDTVEVEGNQISFSFKKSQVYCTLLEKYDEYLRSRFPFDGIKSIYYHEIVHWLRLMPYKINKIGDRAALFYAGMLMVMNDVVERFEADEK